MSFLLKDDLIGPRRILMKKWTKLFSLALGALMAIGAAVGVNQMAERVNADGSVFASFSRSGTTDTKTGGTLSNNLSNKTGYYQDNSTSQQYYIQLLNSEAYWTTTPISISFTAKLGGGTAKDDLTTASQMYVGLLNNSGSVIAGTETVVTKVITSASGSDFTVSITPTNNVYGVKLYHQKLASYNVRYYNFSLSAEFSSESSISLDSISCSPMEVDVGKRVPIDVSFTPSNATNKKYEVSVKDGNDKINIEDNAVVGVKAGSATITITPEDTNASPIDVSVTVNGFPKSALAIDDVYVITASADLKNYELTGIDSNIGSYAEYTTTPAKTYPLTVCEGYYENTIAFKNGDNYLALTVDDNKLSTLTSVTEQSSWIVTFSSNVYSIKNVAFSRYLKYNKSNPRFACYVNGQTDIDLYQISTDPSISISCSSDVSKLMAGNSYEFIYETENISGTPSITWTSSNTDVATIASDGTLTGVGLGITNITATANGSVTSDPIQVTVWPNNSKTITISNAISIAQFAGENKSPFTYTVEGNVTVDNVATFTLTDSTGSLRVYLIGNKVSVNDHVVATGLLQMYTENKDSVPSMRSNVSLDCSYNVYFISEGNQFHVTQNVADGDTIENPGTPIPSNESFSFVGWFDGNRKWDFDTDTVNQDVTLVANWSNGLDTSAQLNIKYNYNEATTGQQFTDVLTSADFEATTTSYVAFSDVTKTSTAVYAGNSAKDSSGAIQLRSKNSESGVVSIESAGFVKSVSFEVSSGSGQVDVYGSNNPYNDAADLYGSSQGALIGTSTTNATISFEGQYKYFGLRSNSGAIFLSSITIVWDSSTPFEVTKVDEYALRFSCEFDDDTIASYFETPANWKCGFMVAQKAQMETTFEESYEYLQDVLKISEDPIADVAAGAMMEDTSAKVSMYKNTMDQLPTPVDDKYEFSVNVTIPETKLTSVVSATWFAYNTVTKEMIFASQKNMSIKEICGIYTTDEDYLSILTANQKAALDCIVADHGWTY